MTVEELKYKAHDIVLDMLPNVDSSKLTDDQDIFHLGLNSINAMTLIFNLQDAFGVEFNGNDLCFDNFRTVADIVKLIDQKQRV